MKTIEQLTVIETAWYSSNDEEVWHGGPYATREEAEQGAKYEEHRLIIQATKGPIRVSRYFDQESFFEAAEEVLHDLTNEDGDPILDFDQAVNLDLQARVRAAIDEWQVAHQLSPMPWRFDSFDDPEVAAWAKAPERIWAWKECQGDVWTGEWSPEKDRHVPDHASQFVRADLHDAAIQQRDELAADLDYMKENRGRWMDAAQKARTERDAALARVAAVIEVAGNTAAERCAACGASNIGSLVREYIRRLTPIDAQAALDKLIADARADAFEEAADMAANRGQQMFSQELRARINEPQEPSHG